jgi:hypothetical protein
MKIEPIYRPNSASGPYQIGEMLIVRDTNLRAFKAQVIQIDRYAAAKYCMKVHFLGWSSNWDIYMKPESPLICRRATPDDKAFEKGQPGPTLAHRVNLVPALF